MGAKWEDSLIVVDSREQEPYWTGAVRAALKTGDYSVAGYEDKIAIERKSPQDLLGSLGGKKGARRARLLREFRRLSLMPWGAFLVESTAGGLYTVPRFGRITPAHAIGTLLRWGGRYRVPVWFCAGRAEGKSICRSYLRLAWEELTNPRHDTPQCPCGGGMIVEHEPRCPARLAL